MGVDGIGLNVTEGIWDRGEHGMGQGEGGG